jgi:hypothetical protein
MQIFAAADSVDITPLAMLPLAGFQGRQGLATGIADRLEINAVLFRDETGRSCVIVSIDTLYIGPAADAQITAHLCERYGFGAAHAVEHEVLAADPRAALCDRPDCLYCKVWTYNKRAWPTVAAHTVRRFGRAVARRLTQGSNR